MTLCNFLADVRELLTLSGDRCRYCDHPLRGLYRRWVGACIDCCYRMQFGGSPLTPEMRAEREERTSR